jgi:hypothetical protein
MVPVYSPDDEDRVVLYSATEYTLKANSVNMLPAEVAEHVGKTLALWGFMVLVGEESDWGPQQKEAEATYSKMCRAWCENEALEYAEKASKYSSAGLTLKPTPDQEYALKWLKAHS